MTDEWQEEKQGREDVGSAHDTRNLNGKCITKQIEKQIWESRKENKNNQSNFEQHTSFRVYTSIELSGKSNNPARAIQ